MPVGLGVMQTYSGQERRVISELRLRKQIEAFCPLIKHTFTSRNQPQSRLAPLFPSYVFYKIPNDMVNTYDLRFITGLNHILLSDRIRPAVLPIDFEDALWAGTDEEWVWNEPLKNPDEKIFHPIPIIPSGSRVRFLQGSAFCGLEGITETACAHDRLRILFNVLGGERSVEVARADVELV
ncbi:MAG: transcription termination/antitermination NusG family protein [Methylocella sp.]